MLDHAVQRTIEKSNKNCYSLVYRVHNYIKRLIWYLYIYFIFHVRLENTIPHQTQQSGIELLLLLGPVS